MPEQHNIEYKQSWHDDYLKWVCGFANAQGGVIYIGKDDNGNVDDIDERTVATFLQASQNAGRLPENAGLSIPELFEKLRLAEKGQLKRAAIVLFGKEPAKFYPNTFVKIGRFGKDDADLKFQETEEGNLIVLLQSVLAQLNHKFLTRSIEFEGMHRIEKGEYPVPAIREMLLNAIHRNYMGAPIQIRVYDDKINIWNEGLLPDGLTLEALKFSHSSRPRNPIIADVSFKGGYIDAWGRGTIKILDTCKLADLPEPEMKERDGGFIITLFKDSLTEEQLIKLGLNDRQLKTIFFVKEKGKISNTDFQQLHGVSKATATRDLTELVEKYELFEKLGQIGAGTVYVLKKIGS